MFDGENVRRTACSRLKLRILGGNFNWLDRSVRCADTLCLTIPIKGHNWPAGCSSTQTPLCNLLKREHVALEKLLVERTRPPLRLTARSVDLTETSGGAIFHTGSMRVFNTSFVANKAGVEGPAVMSVGFLEEMSNVSFSENAFFCRVGEYGYLDKSKARRIACRRCRMRTSFCRPNRTYSSTETGTRVKHILTCRKDKWQCLNSLLTVQICTRSIKSCSII